MTTPRIISSRANPLIKELVKLDDRKYREKLGKFCFEGRKLLTEALSCNVPLEALLFTEKAYKSNENIRLLEKAEEVTTVYQVSDEVYDKISFEKSPEGIFCVSKTLDKSHNLYIIYKGSDPSEHILVLDGIRDPGNLGTILRTASAFGTENIILSSDCADLYNSKTVRASMGAVFRMRTSRVSDLPGTLIHLRNNGVKVRCAALSVNSQSLNELSDKDKTVFVIGNEGSGIRPEVIKASDGTVIIPMEPGTESLNAASAATVILWEQYRQRKLR